MVRGMRFGIPHGFEGRETPREDEGMKFFIDTAFVDEIRQALELGILDGVTTNPTLVSKTGEALKR